MSVIAACLVIYNFYTGKTPHEKLAGEGICFIWIFVVMWQLWPPIGVVLGEIWAEMRNKDETEAAPAVDPKVRHLHPFLLLHIPACCLGLRLAWKRLETERCPSYVWLV
jgi:hypothetical protein